MRIKRIRISQNLMFWISQAPEGTSDHENLHNVDYHNIVTLS